MGLLELEFLVLWIFGSTNGGQWNDIAADWMVTPLALSAGRKSVTVEPSSTSVDQVKELLHDL